MFKRKSVFPEAATQSSSPRVAANNGAFPPQASKSLYSSGWEHLLHGTRATSSGKISKSSQNPISNYLYLHSLLDDICVQTTHIMPPSQSSHPPGIGLTYTSTSHQPGGKNSSTRPSVGENNFQPVDTAGDKGVQVGLQGPTPAIAQASDSGNSPSDEVNIGGGAETIRERCNPGGERGRGGLLFKVVSSPQEGWPDAACDKPPTLEPILGSQPFQNGGYACGERSLTEERLDDKNRSQRCLFLDPHQPDTLEVSAVQMAGKDISVHMPSLRTCFSAESLHEDSSSSRGVPPQQRDTMCHLPGRHSPSRAGQDQAHRTHCNDCVATGSLGVSSELPQVSPRTSSEADLPGLHNRFSNEGAEPPAGKNGGDCKGSQSNPRASEDFSSISRSADQEDVGSFTGDSACPSSLPELTKSQTHSIEEERLRRQDRAIPVSTQRPGMVGSQSVRVERPSNPGTRSNSGNRDRCLEERLGSIFSGDNDRWMLECSGSTTPHKLPRNDGSLFCHQSLCQGVPANHNFIAHRQHFSGSPYQQNGRHKISAFDFPGEGPVGMVSSKTNHSHSSAPTRSGQCDSGLSLQALNRSDRLDARSQYLSMSGDNLGTNAGRPVCNTIYQTTSSFLQLEARPRGGGYRRSGTELVEYQGICTPSMVSDFTCFVESSVRQGNNSINHSLVAHPSMVSNVAGITSGLSSPVTSGTANNCSLPQLCGSSTGDDTPTGRLEGLRQRLRAGKISDGAIDLIFCSWREKTNSNYNSAWRSWESWCITQSICPFSPDIPNVLDFLTEKFQAGLKYRSLNCYRSALSSALLPIDGFQVGQHPLVIRLMKGVFNSRPPEPRYSQMWEVSLVLDYIRALGPNENLSLKLLSRKLATLLALVLAHRSSDLSRLSLHGRKYSAEGVVLRLSGLAKQARPGKEKSLQPVFIARYSEDKLLCPIACLKAYEKATVSFRKENQQLFLAVISPHNPVTSSTIARWLKQAITASGISAEFTAHSMRGASSTAAAMNGVTICEVMEHAGWSSKSTFCKHYFRPSEQATLAAEFGASVLKQSTNMQRTC